MHIDNKMADFLEQAAAEGITLPLPLEHALEKEVVKSCYRLVAAVWKMALRDAIRRGDEEAKEFLSSTLPGWERLIAARTVMLATLDQAERSSYGDVGDAGSG
jgi:hypothetical protein